MAQEFNFGEEICAHGAESTTTYDEFKHKPTTGKTKKRAISAQTRKMAMVIASFGTAASIGFAAVPNAPAPTETVIETQIEETVSEPDTVEPESPVQTNPESDMVDISADEPVLPEPEITEVIPMTDIEWINNADISWIDPEKPMVALSFDDGPVPLQSEASSAMRIQKSLYDNGMHATFFYWGYTLNSATEKELVSAFEHGFELGNHTFSHPDLTKLSAEEIAKELSYVNSVLSRITGEEHFLIRPPYLACNDFVKENIDVPLISCGLDTKDWDNASAEDIINTITRAVENGTLDGKIVLMHETYDTTAEAMEYLVPYLKDQGYQVVTISEMYKARGKVMKSGKIYTQCVK